MVGSRFRDLRFSSFIIRLRRAVGAHTSWRAAPQTCSPVTPTRAASDAAIN